MPSFDVVTEVPGWLRALLAADCPLKGVLRTMMFPMLLLQLVLLGRGSLMSRFCPLYEDVEVGPGGDCPPRHQQLFELSYLD